MHVKIWVLILFLQKITFHFLPDLLSIRLTTFIHSSVFHLHYCLPQISIVHRTTPQQTRNLLIIYCQFQVYPFVLWFLVKCILSSKQSCFLVKIHAFPFIKTKPSMLICWVYEPKTHGNVYSGENLKCDYYVYKKVIQKLKKSN